MKSKHRLAIVVSHPIQHFVHYYRALAARPEIELKVFFCSRIGLDRYFDREMNTEIAWKTDLTGGYAHEFLPKADQIRRTGFREVDNPKIRLALDAFNPTTVLVYGYGQLTVLRALRWCQRHRVPLMMTADSELLRERAGWKTMIKAAALPRLLGAYTCFLTTGDYNEAYYRHYGVSNDRFFRVPFSIDETIYRDVRDRRMALRSAFRAAYGIGESEFVALTVGKVYGGKRPQDIVAAARMIQDDAPSTKRIHFVMAGNGQLYDELLAATTAENLPITWLGFVNVDRLPEVYCAADVLLHPSERDAHPLVCAEAACIGLPLVLSNRVGAVGPTDIARTGRNAIVFPCANASAIADTVRELALDPTQVARLGRASIEIFDELDVTKSVDGTLAALAYCARTMGAAAA
jgi:glycosyltransferase involved in cell wall biosynthesis